MMVEMSVNMEGTQFLLVLGLRNSSATFFPKVSPWKQALHCLPLTACWGPPSELDRVQETGFYRWGN